MIILYHILTTALLLLVLPVLPLIWLVSEKRRANLLQRLGLFTGIPPKNKGEYRIWVHALSVGEVNSALPFVTGLKEKRPGADILFTASTRTGFETARSSMSPEKEGSPVSGLGYFPFDVWICILAVMDRIRPDLVCLVETDLWPGFLSIMKYFGIPVVLINARLSPKSLNNYKRMGRFSAIFFSGLSHVMAQTENDARGFEQLGISQERLSVTGNIKFDQACMDMTDEEIQLLKINLGIRPGQKVWIAGSTHEGEESMLVRAFIRAKKDIPDLKLIIAPRNPKRCRRLIRDLSLGANAEACLSDTEFKRGGADVLFIDAMGELARAYSVSDLAFIGGSLVEEGGHNPLEPAMFAKPILFGPHMTDFQEVEKLLLEAGGAVRVSGERELSETVMSLLGDPNRRELMGGIARTVFSRNSGALERILTKFEGDFLV